MLPQFTEEQKRDIEERSKMLTEARCQKAMDLAREYGIDDAENPTDQFEILMSALRE